MELSSLFASVLLTAVSLASTFSLIAACLLKQRIDDLEKIVLGRTGDDNPTRPFRRNDPLADDPPPGWSRSD